MMRSVIALLLLGLGGWVPPGTQDCALARSAVAGSGHAREEPPPERLHGGSHQPAVGDGTAGEESSGGHSDDDCARTMGCGSPGVSPPLASVAEEAETVRSSLLLGVSAYTTIFPTHDPPPPRLSA